jgi:choline dehydrogenase
MRSGIGAAGHLRELGIPVAVDLPGVGENLCDHPKAYLVWEASRPVPTDGTPLWETALLARTDPAFEVPDIVFPALTGVNPCLTVMMVGERCAELVRSAAAR